MPPRGVTIRCAFVECQTPFVVTFGAEKYCSVKCRNTAWGRRGQVLRKATQLHPGILRMCLRCDQSFKSVSAQNRICPVCKTSRDWQEGDTAEFAFQRGAGMGRRAAHGEGQP